ncbi:MAG: glycosyltransferase [Stellaceae bacterium]
MTGSVLFYVQHLLGIGHLRRAHYLINGMTRQGLAVTLVSGGEPLPELKPVAARHVVQLPPIRAGDSSFKTLVGADGRLVDDALWAARREALLAAYAKAKPDALVIEAYPFGRRAFRRELEPLLAAARLANHRTLVFCSLRDVVVAPADEQRAIEIVARVRADFDAVLVHGDPRLIALEASFARASEIADRLIYTGYVNAPQASIDAEETAGIGEVLVSAGGGAVGGALLRAALGARRLGYLADASWRLLAGPNLPAKEFAALHIDLPDGVIVERYRSDFSQMLRRCRVSVSQAGYNTVLDVISAGIPSVLVPFAEMRETEQTLRAERLAACGVVEMLEPTALSPERLGDAIKRAVARHPAALKLNMGGARRAASIIAEMICDRAGADMAKI